MVTRTYQERFKTLQGVFDNHTERNLFELESHKVFDELISPLKVGKESNVFLAKKRSAGNEEYVIVKIYRVQNCDFKRMFEYIRKDPRYMFLKQKRREIIFSWTQREYRNLIAAAKAGVNVPKAISWRSHILVEELIGEPAPPLKDLPPKNPKKFFALVIEEVKKLYQGGLIHGDLSAFNILNDHEKPYLIDFSQATVTKTPNSEELLERDIKNICQFFKKLGVKADAEEIKQEIIKLEPKTINRYNKKE
ncbi:serine protein kinase RIO [Candidatus Woesearchaeota archaeon]|nr:serine protein kinase RIO [Candidatus Woesearchaeota archaeon]